MTSGQGKELLASPWIVAHYAVQRRRDGPSAGLLHSAERHAEVLGLDHDADAARLERFADPPRDLRREALLDLQAARVQVDDAAELRQPDDALAGQIADVRDAVERQEVVLAERVEADVAGDDELVVALVVGE